MVPARAGTAVRLEALMFARTLTFLVIFVALAVPSFAQTPSLEPNPLITSTTQTQKDPGPLAEFKGYIGTAVTADTVRIYRDLSLTMFYDIPRAAVLQSSQKPGDLSAEVTVIVAGDAVITVGAKGKAALVSSLAATYGQQPATRTISACAQACFSCGWVAASCAVCLGCEIAYFTSH